MLIAELGWVAAILTLAVTALAHPLPNTVIAVSIDERRAGLDIAVPAPELLLAMTGDAHLNAKALLANDRKALAAYLDAHLSVLDADGA